MKILKKRIFSFLTVMLIAMTMVGLVPVSADTVYSVSVKTNEKYTMAYQTLTLINKERTKRGLSSLTMDKDMLDAAMQRAAEISIAFSHDRPDGSSFFDDFEWEFIAAENIAFGQTSAANVTAAWMNSEGHRNSILTSDFKSTGIGCAYINGTYYWTQIFDGGKPVSVSKPADNTVSRTVKISSKYKTTYLPSAAPVISSITSNSTSVTVKWGKVSKANGYRVYKYDESTKKYKSLATVSSGTLSYTDKTVKPGDYAKYKIRAYRKVGAVTGWSSYSSAKYKNVAPAQVKITSASKTANAVRLNWSKVNCTGYKIYRYVPSTGKYKLVATVSSGTVTYRMSGLTPNTAYKFKIRAYSRTASGSYVYGSYSNVKTVTTKSK